MWKHGNNYIIYSEHALDIYYQIYIYIYVSTIRNNFFKRVLQGLSL